VNDLQRGSTDSLLEVLGVAGAGILTAVMTGGAMWLLGRYAVVAGMRIRELLHDRLLFASLDLYRTHPTGQLVARATADVEPIKLFITSAVSVVAQARNGAAASAGANPRAAATRTTRRRGSGSDCPTARRGGGRPAAGRWSRRER
jgi:ABC-type multidrug transport system fused ATPase/permease subunit